MRSGVLLGGLCVGLLTLAGGRPADACHNGYEPRIDPKVGAVANAERLVHEGHASAALSQVLSAYPSVAGLELGRDRLASRALLVAARVVVRSDGELGPAIGAAAAPKDDRSDRERRLAWALGVMRKQALQLPQDPIAATDLGEALERLPEHRAEALRVLSDLESRDLLATGQAHASLARLRRTRGAALAPWAKAAVTTFESTTVELELGRCRARVKDERGCRLEPGAS